MRSVLAALDRKLFRDLWHVRGQALAIAAVIASGVALFVTELSTQASLALTRSEYYAQYRFAEVFARCFKFAFVRNPWDKAVSQYAYMAQREDLRRFVGMPAQATFKQYLTLIARRRHVQWEPQLSFLLDANGELLVDFVGRYERLAADAQEVLRCLGLPGRALPHANPSQRRAYQEYYDDEAREMVAAMYAEDIRWFGYHYQQQPASARCEAQA